MPEYFSKGEIQEILGAMILGGKNESVINNDYNYNYSLWYGLRAVWNYTTSDYVEKPSFNDDIIILQDPSDFKTFRFELRKNQKISRNEIIENLIKMQYERNDFN